MIDMKSSHLCQERGNMPANHQIKKFSKSPGLIFTDFLKTGAVHLGCCMRLPFYGRQKDKVACMFYAFRVDK